MCIYMNTEHSHANKIYHICICTPVPTARSTCISTNLPFQNTTHSHTSDPDPISNMFLILER